MPWQCEECPVWHGWHSKHGVIALTATRSPTRMPSTAEPTAWTTPTDSCPRVLLTGIGIAPPMVCTSEVQTIAAVVRTIASLGPGPGIGFSMTATRPISGITNARMTSGMCSSCFVAWMADLREPSAVDEPAVGGTCGLHHALRQRRVAVDDPRHLGVATLERLGVHELLDELGGLRADDVPADQLAVLLVADDL